MTSIERIQAAIDKLDKLKADSTPGPWASANEHGNMPSATPAWCISKTSDDGQWLGDVAYLSQMGGSERADAELIVTLHCTIDPILDWLRLTVDNEFADWLSELQFQKALALADAILGDAE